MRKKRTTWRLNNMLLRNQCVNEEVKMEIQQYLEKNDNENTAISHLMNATKEDLREKCIIIEAPLKQRRIWKQHVTDHLKDLEKEECRVPIMAYWKGSWLATMRSPVWNLASLSGIMYWVFAKSCGEGRRCGSELALLWHSLVGTALVWPPAGYFHMRWGWPSNNTYRPKRNKPNLKSAGSRKSHWSDWKSIKLRCKK